MNATRRLPSQEKCLLVLIRYGCPSWCLSTRSPLSPLLYEYERTIFHRSRLWSRYSTKYPLDPSSLWVRAHNTPSWSTLFPLLYEYEHTTLSIPFPLPCTSLHQSLHSLFLNSPSLSSLTFSLLSNNNTLAFADRLFITSRLSFPLQIYFPSSPFSYPIK